MQFGVLPVFLFVVCVAGLAVVLLLMGNLLNPARQSRVKQMPYESGMDPIHDTRRRFDVRFHLVAIAFLVFDVELLLLYPWAVAARPAPIEVAPMGVTAVDSAAIAASQSVLTPASVPRGIDAAVSEGLVESRTMVFIGVMVFLLLLTLGFVYDWRKGIFRWR